MYYKLVNRANATDYKELDIEQIISAYTSADSTMAVVITEEVIENDGITVIYENEFNTLRDLWEIERQAIKTTFPQPTLEEKNRSDIDYMILMQGL